MVSGRARPDSDATWEDDEYVITQIPEFIAEDSSNLQGAAMSGEARLLAVAALN